MERSASLFGDIKPPQEQTAWAMQESDVVDKPAIKPIIDSDSQPEMQPVAEGVVVSHDTSTGFTTIERTETHTVSFKFGGPGVDDTASLGTLIRSMTPDYSTQVALDKGRQTEDVMAGVNDTESNTPLTSHRHDGVADKEPTKREQANNGQNKLPKALGNKGLRTVAGLLLVVGGSYYTTQTALQTLTSEQDVVEAALQPDFRLGQLVENTSDRIDHITGMYGAATAIRNTVMGG